MAALLRVVQEVLQPGQYTKSGVGPRWLRWVSAPGTAGTPTADPTFDLMLLLQAFQGLENGKGRASRDAVALGSSLLHTEDLQTGRAILMSALQDDSADMQVRDSSPQGRRTTFSHAGGGMHLQT